MAAQGSEKKFNICDRCFASVPSGLAACPECGAPIQTEEKATEQGDSQVYHELARANLLRMRGDYLAAEAECLKILRRFPNNASAHTLLGDIYNEKGDPEQALQWYELSIDLVDDGAVTEKIAAAKRRIADRDQATTARELGLPAERSQKAKFVLFVLIPVIVVFIAAYALGRRNAGTSDARGSKVVPPINMPGHDPVVDPREGSPKTASNQTAGSEIVLLERIKTATADGANLQLVLQDPRTKDLTLSYMIEEDKQIRPMGARIASAALDTVPDALQVTVRAMRGGNLIYIANVHRSRLNETKQPNWQTENRDNPSAWIDYVLENEWTTVPKSPSTTPADDGGTATRPDVPGTTPEQGGGNPSGVGQTGAPNPGGEGSPAPDRAQEGPTSAPPKPQTPASVSPTG